MSNDQQWSTTATNSEPDPVEPPHERLAREGDVPPEPLTHSEILKVMTGLLGVLFTAMLATTIVSTALPTIMADLSGTQRQYTWVITASLLAMTVSTPIWGKLSDVFSKKLLVQISIGLFVVGSIGAGLSTAIPPLMIFRAVQGLAMGGLTALAQSIMGSIISPRDRGRYSGYMAAVMTVSTVAGPVIGGVITDTLGWRWCFLIVVPIAVAASILLQRTLQLEHRPRKVHFDYAGALLFTVAAALPMLWVTFAGEDYAWLSWQTLAFGVGFGLAAGLAVFVELRSPEPIVPLRLLANRTSILMIVAGMGAGVSMFASGVFMTQFFQLAGGFDPTIAGLMTIPLIIAQMLSTTIGGQIVSRTGRWKPLMLGGGVLLVIGLFLLGSVDHTTPYAFTAVAMFVMGLGIGTMVQNTVLAVQNSVAVKDVGSASATVSFFRSLGGAIGVSALGAVLVSQVSAHVISGLTSAGVDPSVLGSSGGNLDIGALPVAVQTIVHHAYGDSFGLLFQIAGVIAVAVLAAVLFSPETRLRNTIDLPEKPEVDAAKV